MPNHRGSMPAASTIGKITDVVSTTTEIPSRKHPRRMKNRVSAISNMLGDRPKVLIQAASSLGIPVKPIELVRKWAPTRMKAIIDEVLTVPISPLAKVFQFSEPLFQDRRCANATPMAADSVGDARPA